MKIQKTKYTCGPASIVNVLKCFGINTKESVVRQYSDTDTCGTEDAGVIKALEHFKFKVLQHEQDNYNKAWKWLRKQVLSGMPAIIAVENWGHYVAIIGVIGNKVVMFDPSYSQNNKKENGVYVLSKIELDLVWKNKYNSLYTGLAVKRS